MRINTFLTLLFSFLILFACSKEEPATMQEEEEEQEEIVPDPEIISLTYPAEGSRVHYCCFSLEWEDSENSSEYQVQISDTKIFADLLLDTIVTGTTLEFPSILYPTETYHWRVISKDETREAAFKIIDYRSRLSKSHDARIKIFSWIHGEGSMEEYHDTRLHLSAGSEGYSINHNTSLSEAVYNIPFVFERNEGFALFEIKHAYPGDEDYIEYHFENDSIFIRSYSGANGGGGGDHIWAIYEE